MADGGWIISEHGAPIDGTEAYPPSPRLGLDCDQWLNHADQRGLPLHHYPHDVPMPSTTPTKRTGHDTPLSMLWQTRSIMWTMLGAEALAILLTLSPGLWVDRWIFFGLLSFLLQWIALLTLALVYLAKPLLANVSLYHLAWIVVVLLVVSASVLGSLTWAVLPSSTLLYEGGVAWLAWLRLVGMISVAGVLAALAFQNHWRSRQLALRAKQAELDALRARVNPHFLFNTLNTVTALLHEHPSQAERVLLDLSDLFRAALSGNGGSNLHDEVQLTRRYLEIESLRLGTRLQIEWQLPDVLPDAHIPVLALQSLAENAIHHGIEHLAHGGLVVVAVEPRTTSVVLRVVNPLPSRPMQSHDRHHVGLAASRSRIEAMSAGLGSLRTRSDGVSHVAEIELPLLQHAAPQPTTS